MPVKTLRRAALPLATLLGGVGWAILLMGANSTPTGSSIAVIDSNRITANSRTVQREIANVSTEAKKAKEDFEKKQAELQAASDRYAKQQSVASKEENEKRLKEVNRLKDELDEITYRLNRELKKAQEKMIGPMQEKIMAAVKEMAAARRISVVLSKENTIYYDAAVDLTNEVIAKLDAK